MSDDLPNQPQSIQPTGSMAKEVMPPTGHIEAPLVTEIGKEVELSPDVAKMGVTVKSDSVVLPIPVQQTGVSSIGARAPVTVTTTTVSLPLTDDQIAQGLHQSIMTSWRWLAQWCKRQLQIFIRT